MITNTMILYNKTILIKVKIVVNINVCIYPLHYYYLPTPKCNDMRKMDSDIKEVQSVEDGLVYNCSNKIVFCLSIDSVNGDQYILDNCLYDICLHSDSQR